MWTYKISEPGLFTVGFYSPSGGWHSDSDYNSREEAAQRVSLLNGETRDASSGAAAVEQIRESLQNFVESLDDGRDNWHLSEREMGRYIVNRYIEHVSAEMNNA